MYKPIISIVPTIQAASLAGSMAKKATKKDKKAEDTFGMAVETIVGTSLISKQASLIAGLE